MSYLEIDAGDSLAHLCDSMASMGHQCPIYIYIYMLGSHCTGLRAVSSLAAFLMCVLPRVASVELDASWPCKRPVRDESASARQHHVSTLARHANSFRMLGEYMSWPPWTRGLRATGLPRLSMRLCSPSSGRAQMPEQRMEARTLFILFISRRWRAERMAGQKHGHLPRPHARRTTWPC